MVGLNMCNWMFRAIRASYSLAVGTMRAGGFGRPLGPPTAKWKSLRGGENFQFCKASKVDTALTLHWECTPSSANCVYFGLEVYTHVEYLHALVWNTAFERVVALCVDMSTISELVNMCLIWYGHAQQSWACVDIVHSLLFSNMCLLWSANLAPFAQMCWLWSGSVDYA